MLHLKLRQVASEIIWPLATNVCSYLLYWQAASFQYAITTILRITLYLTVSTLFTDYHFFYVLTTCKFPIKVIIIICFCIHNPVHIFSIFSLFIHFTAAKRKIMWQSWSPQKFKEWRQSIISYYQIPFSIQLLFIHPKHDTV